MAIVEGTRSTAHAATTSEFKRSVYIDIWNPETWKNREAAIPAILNNLGKKESVGNWKFEVYDDTFISPFMTVNNGDISNNAVTLTVDDATPILDHNAKSTSGGGTVIHNPRTGENMLVTGTNLSGGTATRLFVIRNYGDTVGDKVASGVEGTGISLVDGDYLVVGAASFPEGSKSPNPMHTKKVASYNYTEIFRMSYKITNRMAKVDSYGGNDLSYQQAKAAQQFKINLAKAFWFNNRGTRTDASVGMAYTTMGGIFQHLTSANELDISGAGFSTGTLTEKVLDQWAEMLFENGSDTRYVFCGYKFINGVGSFKRGITRVDDKGTSFGTEMKEWITPMGGRFLFVAEPKVFNPLWTPVQGSDTGGGATQGTAVALDLDCLTYVYFADEDVALYTDIESDDRPLATKGEWCGDIGLRMLGYGLDNTARTTSGPQRSPHGKLFGFSKY